MIGDFFFFIDTMKVNGVQGGFWTVRVKTLETFFKVKPNQFYIKKNAIIYIINLYYINVSSHRNMKPHCKIIFLLF